MNTHVNTTFITYSCKGIQYMDMFACTSNDNLRHLDLWQDLIRNDNGKLSLMPEKTGS